MTVKYPTGWLPASRPKAYPEIAKAIFYPSRLVRYYAFPPMPSRTMAAPLAPDQSRDGS